eukprot:UN27124
MPVLPTSQVESLNPTKGWVKINNDLNVRLRKQKRKHLVQYQTSAYNLKKRKIDKHKIECNETIINELIRLHPNTNELLQDQKNIIVCLESPTFFTTKEIMKQTNLNGHECQQIIIPQYDLQHYVTMIQNSEIYAGVRAQRLDYWLHVNKSIGFECLLFGL